MNRKELKKLSWKQITPCILTLALITLIIAAFTYFIYVFLFYTIFPNWLIILVSAPFSLSSSIVYLNITNGIIPKTVNAFSGFKKFFKAIWVCVLQNFFTFLWTLLFIIPGIYKAYSYALAPYIMLDSKVSPRKAIKMSKKMMKGHVWELIKLDLSFIGWDLLGVVSCGVALLGVVPYHNSARANFYKELKNKNEFSFENSFFYSFHSALANTIFALSVELSSGLLIA